MSRNYCASCCRPQSECYCDAIVSLANSIRVLILQHPDETDHPYNTGRIVERCLQQCERHVGEQYSDDFISGLAQQQSVLLFPQLAWLPKAPQMITPPKQLVVIDANWRKAKKILHLNPRLQILPRLTLMDVPKSQYQIRRGKITDGLATIESVSYALQQLENSREYKALLTPFQRMVELASRYQPKID